MLTVADVAACSAAWHALDARQAGQERRQDARGAFSMAEQRERAAAFLAAAQAGPHAQVEIVAGCRQAVRTEHVGVLIADALDELHGPAVDGLLAALDDGGQPAALTGGALDLLRQIAEDYGRRMADAMLDRGDFDALA